MAYFLKFYFDPNKYNHLTSKCIKSLNSPQLVGFNPLSHPLFSSALWDLSSCKISGELKFLNDFTIRFYISTTLFEVSRVLFEISRILYEVFRVL